MIRAGKQEASTNKPWRTLVSQYLGLTNGILLLGYLIVAVLAWRYYELRSFTEGRDQPLSLQLRATGEAGRAVQVAFVFDPADCPASLDIIDFWNELHTVHGIGVHGFVMRGPRSRAELEVLRRVGRIEFPLTTLERGTSGVVQQLGYDATPVSIVFDSFGRTQMIVGPEDNSEWVRTTIRGLLLEDSRWRTRPEEE